MPTFCSYHKSNITLGTKQGFIADDEGTDDGDGHGVKVGNTL